jgi:hypothetical protein
MAGEDLSQIVLIADGGFGFRLRLLASSEVAAAQRFLGLTSRLLNLARDPPPHLRTVEDPRPPALRGRVTGHHRGGSLSYRVASDAGRVCAQWHMLSRPPVRQSAK